MANTLFSISLPGTSSTVPSHNIHGNDIQHDNGQNNHSNNDNVEIELAVNNKIAAARAATSNKDQDQSRSVNFR